MGEKRRKKRKDNLESKKPKRETYESLLKQIAMLDDNVFCKIIFNDSYLLYGLTLSGRNWKRIYLKQDYEEEKT